jgi:hypothetical protein
VVVVMLVLLVLLVLVKSHSRFSWLLLQTGRSVVHQFQ